MAEEVRENNNVSEELSAERLNEVLRIRREKLATLQAEGRDPFTITKYDVTHHSSFAESPFCI